MRVSFIASCALAAVSLLAFAQGSETSGFFANRSAEELAALDRGEVVSGRLSDWNRMSLGTAGGAADAVRSRIAALKPNYVAEFLAVAPETGARLERLASALGDVKEYTSMAYHSPRYDKDFPLFDKMEVESRRPVPGGEHIDASAHMQPFEDFEAGYEYVLAGDELAFSSGNRTELRYGGFSAVKPGDMAWCIVARSSGGRTYFYGIGAMRAFDALGLARPRLEPSFDGRVESFMKYMYERMKGSK